MKKVEIAKIQPGSIAECNYYSHRNELLIGKGTKITRQHILALNKRNIYELYIKPTEEEVLIDVLTKEITQLEDLDIEEKSKKPGEKEKSEHATELEKKDFNQLINSDIVSNVDTKMIQEDLLLDSPTGVALKQSAIQIKVGERSEEYLTGVSESYDGAVRKVKYIMDTIVQGNTGCAKEVSNIIRRFTRIFLTDKNILLNISGVNPGADEYIYYHSLNVCILSINIAASYGYNNKQVIEIGTGALLHDIGMLLISNEIRNKTKKYNKADLYEIQKHPVLGMHLLERIKGLPETVLYVAYQAHERPNASGYPKQRADHLIHRYAKLVQVADVYEALSSPRPHRKAFLPYEAVDRLLRMTKANLISGDFVRAFLTYMSLYPIGSLVLLDNQCIAKVVDTNQDATEKPIVSVLTNTKGSFFPKNQIYQIDLKKDKNTRIIQALSLNTYKNISIMDGF